MKKIDKVSKPVNKRIIIAVVISLIIFGGSGYWIGYSIGNSDGNTMGYGKGLERGNYLGYEKGYSAGYDTGKEYVVSHLDQYVTLPKAVKYDDVVTFLKEDKTSDIKYTEDFDCVSFSNMVRENALKKNIKCGEVSFNLKNGSNLIGHCINIFETTDQGIVYFDPQTDGQRYDIRVGGTYTLSGVVYKITKIDVIW